MDTILVFDILKRRDLQFVMDTTTGLDTMPCSTKFDIQLKVRKSSVLKGC